MVRTFLSQPERFFRKNRKRLHQSFQISTALWLCAMPSRIALYSVVLRQDGLRLAPRLHSGMVLAVKRNFGRDEYFVYNSGRFISVMERPECAANNWYAVNRFRLFFVGLFKPVSYSIHKVIQYKHCTHLFAGGFISDLIASTIGAYFSAAIGDVSSDTMYSLPP